MKKTISLFLALLMLLCSFPLAFAEEAPQTETNTDYSIEGTNSFGQMVESALESDMINQEAAYNISNVSVEGQTAVVRFVNTVACTLVVAAYEEETMRLLCSAAVAVEADAGEASVTLSDLSAENIVIKAFLLDDAYHALCKNYTFLEFTKAYKDFMSKTVNDFAADRVINLDEAIDNNFLVLENNVIRVAQKDMANQLLSADYEQNIFVFGNADESITGLQPGDLFYYDNGDLEDMIIVTVTAVAVDESGAATVVGKKNELDNAFQFVHIDSSVGDFELDESSVEEGVSIYNTSSRQNAPKRIGVNIDHTFKNTWGFDFDKKFLSNETEAGNDETAGVKFSGSGDFGIEAEFKICLSAEYQEISIVFTARLNVEFSLKGKISSLNLKLAKFTKHAALGCLKFTLTPTLVFRFSAEISTAVTAGFSVGIGFNMQDGFVNKCEKPTVKFDGIKVEGTVFIGIDLKPTVDLVDEAVAEATMSGEVGVEVKASNSWLEQTIGKTDIHLCQNCIGGDVKFKVNLKANLSFAKNKTWGRHKDFDIAGFSFDICDFYWSFTFDDHGLEKCPYQLTDNNKYNSHYYYAFDKEMSWTAAKAYCENLGGHLATVTSEAENDFLYSIIKDRSKRFYWLGGFGGVSLNKWQWDNGDEWNYTNWSKTNVPNPDNYEGNEDHVAILAEDVHGNPSGTWDDAPNNGYKTLEGYEISQYGFICEWENKSSIMKAPQTTVKRTSTRSDASTEVPITVDGNTAIKTDAVSGTEYVLLAVKDAAAENLLAADNVLYIDQKTADQHTVSFTFALREEYADPAINIYGLSQNHEHSYVATVTKEATCGAAGEMTYTCIDGDDTYTEIIPATGKHTAGAAQTKTIKPATCTAAGETVTIVKCTVCGTVLSEETGATPKTAHTDANNDGVCDVCSKTISDSGEAENACKYCHKVHPDNFIGKLTLFFHNILYFFAHLFGRM